MTNVGIKEERVPTIEFRSDTFSIAVIKMLRTTFRPVPYVSLEQPVDKKKLCTLQLLIG